MNWIREAGASTYYPPLIAELLFSKDMYKVQKELTGMAETLFAFVSEDKGSSHVNHTMWHAKNIDKISTHILKLASDPYFLRRFAGKFEAIRSQHQAYLGNTDVQTIVSMITEAAGFMFITQPHCVEKIEAEVSRRLAKGRPELLNLLTQSEELSTLAKERSAYHSMLRQFSERIDEKAVESHFRTYQVCFMSEAADHNEEVSAAWLKKKIVQDLKTTKKEQKFEDVAAKKAKAIEQYQIPVDILQLCKVLETFAYYRLESHLIWMHWFLNMSQLVEKKAQELGVSKTALENLRLEQFLHATKETVRDVPTKPIKSYIIHIDEQGQHHLFTHDAGRSFLANQKITLLPPDLKELLGKTAYPGKVIGKAALLDESQPLEQQMKKLEEGGVLVAWQTKPNMMPAIMKAGAIVTNEGGITSHAAIVAREFKKPCVMMTRWATDYLKDGDLVEVDAEKGVVRKLA